MIESVNAAVKTILGFQPEQCIGQCVDILIHQGSRKKLNDQITVLLRDTGSRTYHDTLACLNEFDEQVVCEVECLGVKGSGGAVESLVLILKDVTKLQARQDAAAKAKARSEQLLFELLPRDIANRIAAGEQDIAIVVPSATVFFIDIDKFSVYCKGLVPQQIMGTLQKVFCALDDLLPRHALVMRIKYTGDIWMGAAGLFGEHAAAETAGQAIRLSLEALTVMEDVNAKLDACLQVRIGINTGGPIISGVLGTDKPMFDIIGDAINIAARLQTSADPGRIQISEDTFSAVKTQGFLLEERGMVWLKGKGDRMAYWVKGVSVLEAGSVGPRTASFAGADMAPARSSRRQTLAGPGSEWGLGGLLLPG